MALFNNEVPFSPIMPKLRTFQGNWWDNTKLALSGSNTDGTSNVWGKVADIAIPGVLSIVGGYYGGAAGAALGSKAGTLANKGLDAWGSGIMDGTDTKIKYQETTDKQQGNDVLVEGVSNFLGNIAGSMNNGGSGKKKGDEDPDLFSAKNDNKLSALQRIFGKGDNAQNNGFDIQSLTNNILAGINNQSANNQMIANSSTAKLNADMFNINTENNNGMNSSIIDDPFGNGSDIKFLDERRKTTAKSTLPNNQFSGFSFGGQAMPFQFFEGGGSTFNGPSEERNGIKVYSNEMPAPIKAPVVQRPAAITANTPNNYTPIFPDAGSMDIKTSIALAEGSFNKKNPYAERNNVGPGHYGKYQMEPRLIYKFAPGLTIDQFMNSPEAQESAMDKLALQYQSEIKNIRKQTGTNWDDRSLMLLTHFQGSPRGIEMLKKPELLNKKTKNNPSVMDYIGKRSFGIFKDGGVSSPFQFFEEGSEVTPITPQQIGAIRNHYMLEPNDVISKSNAEQIVNDIRGGKLALKNHDFSGFNGIQSFTQLLNKGTGSNPNTLNGNAKVRSRGVGIASVGLGFSEAEMAFARTPAKGMFGDKGKPLNLKKVRNENTKARVKNAFIPFAFFSDGGPSEGGGSGKK